MQQFEEIKSSLLTLENLLIIGDVGTGKSKLVNQIIRHFETQPDYIYVFITQDLSNHTGDNSYGHINGLRLHIDDLMSNYNFYEQYELQNTIIKFPYGTMSKDDDKYDELLSDLYGIYRLCEQNNKKLILIADGMDVNVNTIVYVRSQFMTKCVISLVNPNDIESEFDDFEPTGQRFDPTTRFSKVYMLKF